VSKKLALIIGSSEYDDKNLSRLITPNADVNALTRILRDPEIGDFDEVAFLMNEPASIVRRAISAFFSSRTSNDLLLLYFTGHGIRDDRGRLYLAVKDTEHALLRATSIPASFITEEMDHSRSRRQVLILDCCHSGAFSPGMKAVAGASVGTAAAFEGTGSGRVVLTATDSTQYAWEGDVVIGKAENSVFTHYLIEGLRSGEADSDANGIITLDELYNYVYEQVVNQTPLQTPGKWSYGQRGEIAIARNPHPVVKSVDLPTDLQQTVEDPRPWVREGAVQELDRILRGTNIGLSFTAYQTLKHLADDDSRRVSALAVQCLAAYDAEQGLPETLEKMRETTASQSVPQDQHSRKNSDPLQPVREKVESQQPAVQPIGKKMNRSTGSFRHIHLLGVKLWPVLAIASGWALSLAVGLALSLNDHTATPALIAGVIGGLTLGLILKWTEPSIRWMQVLLITFAWAAVLAMTWGYSSLRSIILGTLGGMMTGLIIRWTNKSLPWKGVMWIAAGWGLASFVVYHMLYALVESVSTVFEIALLGIASGALFGILGSFVIYRQAVFTSPTPDKH
jgi:hypothetical protein